ncbi:MAG: ferrochelatase [Bdellovibrionaceae bacterium]|nr:ferrochelatase [Pseudobdellovibrionaceae bacterium]
MKKAVLMINIGSPNSLDLKDVKDYLEQFLMDPRVINYPYWLRYLLFKKVIIPKRTPNSAEAYEQIWQKEGSPLLIYTQELVDKMNEKDKEYDWFWAMRYSKPTVASRLQEIINRGYEEIVIFPAYPQFADSSTTSSLDVVQDFFKEPQMCKLWQGRVKYVEDFYKNKDFISNIVDQCQNQTKKFTSADHVLFSFHGLPESHLRLIHKSCKSAQCETQISSENQKCYKAQCYQTAKAVAEGLGIQDKYSVSFQSRLGPSKWIEPYTDVVVEDLARKGTKSLVVFSLAFVTDCLETLEELDIRLKDSFLSSGGTDFYRVPCLNQNFDSAFDIIRTEELKILNL